MYQVSFIRGDRTTSFQVATNKDANSEVDDFLARHRPSMHIYALVFNQDTGMQTKVWRGLNGERKHAVTKEII